MFYNCKRLVVVLALAGIIFYFAKPIALRFTSGDDFSRRRMVFLSLTIVSFLVPSFWLYMLVAVPMFSWAARKDSNPIALYLVMLHVVPPTPFNIPIMGNNGLIPLDNYRLLAFSVLLPAVIRYKKGLGKTETNSWGAMDLLLLGTGVLYVALYCAPDLPELIPDSPSNMARRVVLFFLDTYLLYYAVSRLCQSRRQMVDAAASFCLACAIMALVALFENLDKWLLYIEVVGNWGAVLKLVDWLTRGDQLRAMASAGHALSLGYLLAVGFGFWLYLKSHIQSGMRRIAVTILLWGGLFAAYSRGPWLGAVTVYFAYFAAGPRALSRVAKSGIVAVGVGLLIMVSPLGDRIFAVLPIMGQTADANILYRQHLAERGWQIVMQHPFFGDQFPYPEMEDLRQGEGIIDIVNSYLGVALNSGLIGLFLFVSFILIALAKVYARTRVLSRSDPDLGLFGCALIACIIGTLVMIQSNSFNRGSEKMFYVLAGLAAAYAKLASEPKSNELPARTFRATQNYT